MTMVSAARKRLRRAAAMIAALGVVLLGVLPASPAFAAPMAVSVTMTSGGSPVETGTIFFVNDEGVVGSAIGFGYTNASGAVSFVLEPGDYDIYTSPGSRYETTRFTFTVTDSGLQSFAFDVNTYPAITGTVSPALAGTVGINTYRWNGSGWNLVSGMPFLPDASGDFEIWFPDSSGQWTLQFLPPDSDPYRTTYLGGGSSLPYDLSDSSTYFELTGPNTVVDVGSTTLIAAGIVTGTVTGLGGTPIEEAYVVVDDLDQDQIAETTTDENGAYTIKVPLNQEFTVRAYADGWMHEFFDDVYDHDQALSHEFTSLDLEWADVDFELFPEVNAHFNLYTEEEGTPEPFDANTWLFYDSGSGFSPVPFSVEWDYDEAAFSELLPGTYRVGLQLVDESGWIPFSAVNVVPGTIPAAGSACYFEFEVTGDILELEFDLTADPTSSACTEAPWIAGSASPGTVSGIVTNIDEVTGAATATLYLDDPGWGPLEITSTTVDPLSGEFSLDGVYVDGEYFVGIETARDNPHLDMFFGDGAETLLYYLYDDLIDGFDLLAQDDQDDVDVTLPPARVLSGIVSSSGVPVEGICVTLINSASSGGVDCQPTDSDGRYFVKAPAPTPPSEIGYKIYVSDLLSDVYWGADSVDGDEIVVDTDGIDPFSYDIEIAVFPTIIVGNVAELDDQDDAFPVSNGKAHLYKKIGANWVEVESVLMVEDSGLSSFGFPGEVMDALAGGDIDDLFTEGSLDPGDYRIWFSQNGEWLPITEYLMVKLSMTSSVDPDEFEGVTCYLDLSGTPAHTFIFYLGISVDPALAVDCAPPAPPTPTSPVTPTPPKTPSSGPPSGSQGSDAPDEETSEEQPQEEQEAEEAPSPSPSPSPSETPAPDASGGGTPAGGFDALPWIIALFAVLVVGGGVTLFVVRRRS